MGNYAQVAQMLDEKDKEIERLRKTTEADVALLSHLASKIARYRDALQEILKLRHDMEVAHEIVKEALEDAM